MKNSLLTTILLLGGLVCAPLTADSQTPLTAAQYQEDFDTLWKEMAASYAYFDRKQTDWEQVRRRYRPRAASIADRAEFIALLERTLEELYDFHCNLNTNTESSPVLVPTDADLWAEWRQGHAVITEVRPHSPASDAGIRAGMEVVSLQGTAVRQAVNDRLGSCLRHSDPEADNWALRTLLAGRHNETRRIQLRQGETVITKTVPVYRRTGTEAQGLLEYRLLAQKPPIGYIRLHNSLGDIDLIAAFDRALDHLKSTQGLILDLRDTPSGGNTVVARALMGRLISRTMFYQKHSLPAEERAYGVRRSWVEEVSPRGPFRYTGPVFVLVDHWTGSMGEGVTIGLDAMNRTRTVGTEMARLLGATESVLLPHSGISVHFPAEKLFQVNGKPREAFVPQVYINLLSPSARRKEDPILEAGQEALSRALKGRRHE
jgi:carboxyl-terminal processing protease